MKEKVYGKITTHNGRIPEVWEAFEADLDMGSHNLTNMAHDVFEERYPTIVAVLMALEEEHKKLSKLMEGP